MSYTAAEQDGKSETRRGGIDFMRRDRTMVRPIVSLSGLCFLWLILINPVDASDHLLNLA